MKAKLIVVVDGRLISGCEVTAENILPAFEVRGFEMIGIEDNPRRRAELQGWPVFSGLYGPMWNGDSVRYETAEAHNICSA
jgi:hypothetical protein